MSVDIILIPIYELDFFDNLQEELIQSYLLSCYTLKMRMTSLLLTIVRESYHALVINEPEDWMETYNEMVFFQLYRMRKETFTTLVDVILLKDRYKLLKKKYRGGNYPVQPEKSVLIFLWYISKQDTLNSIADRFRVVPSTVMHIVNAVLYLILSVKKQYIVFPQREEDFENIRRQFTSYPGVIGAVDGTHIKIKVPIEQHDSYVDRYLSHSINLMGISTSQKLFTYIFVGFPGSAHDSRVFSNSSLVRHIEQNGKGRYFPSEDYHLIGDSAFPIRTWLMKPYSQINCTRVQKHHNYCLSADRICIEHTFGILKGRWRRLQFINTYSVSKAVEITTAACVLHNFCYLHQDEWEGEQVLEEEDDEEFRDDNRQEQNLGRAKRDRIARILFDNNIP